MSWYSEGNPPPPSASAPPPFVQEPHGDVATVEVSALVPIMATAANRPLRALSRILVVVGMVFAVLSLAGSVAWIVTVGSAVDFARDDIQQANDEKDDRIYFDLEEETGNVKLVLSLAGLGVGAVGFALGIVIVVIGGVARQLDRTLAPIGTKAGGVPAMAAVAYPS